MPDKKEIECKNEYQSPKIQRWFTCGSFLQMQKVPISTQWKGRGKSYAEPNKACIYSTSVLRCFSDVIPSHRLKPKKADLKAN